MLGYASAVGFSLIGCVASPRLNNQTCSVFVSVRKKTERSKKFFTDLMAKEHVPTMINPKPCGHLCCCAITGCEEVTLTLTLALTLMLTLCLQTM